MLNFIQIGLLIATSCHAIRSHPLTVHNAFDKSASNQQAAPTQFQVKFIVRSETMDVRRIKFYIKKYSLFISFERN